MREFAQLYDGTIVFVSRSGETYDVVTIGGVKALDEKATSMRSMLALALALHTVSRTQSPQGHEPAHPVTAIVSPHPNRKKLTQDSISPMVDKKLTNHPYDGCRMWAA